ncbi:HAMP domain-containing protein [bacterium]|nr:HAMP domain-containing protein [bacterium]
MHFSHLSRVSRSIGFRLTLWNSLIIVLCGAATLLGLRVGLYRALLSEADNGLLDDLLEVERTLNDQQLVGGDAREVLERKAESHVHHAWFVQLFNAGNNEQWGSRGRPDGISLKPNGIDAIPRTSGEYRMVSQKFESPIQGVHSIQVGMSLRSIDGQMTRADWIAFPIAISILAVAPALGFWLSQRATRPLRDMIDSIARIRENDLGGRLPIRGAGDEIDHLSVKINDLLDRLGLYLRSNRDFVTNAAHEIRSPLAAIHGSVEYALSHHRSEAEYKELLGDMMERTHALTSMVNQLLFLAEAESDRLRVSTDVLDLLSLAEKTVSMFEALAESKFIKLELVNGEKVFAKADARHMSQVVMNLVDNAIKFTDLGGRIEVEVRRDVQRSVAVLVVRDSGMGIGPDELPHVFDRFYRGKFARYQRQGTGLGLSICKSIVTASGGRISVSSKIGEGTEFRVELVEAVQPPLNPSSSSLMSPAQSSLLS